MDDKKLSPEQQEKLKSCKTPEEMIELAKQEGYDLTDEQLEGISGGSWCPLFDPDAQDPCPRRR